jgi:hypothetical protein
MEDLLLNIKGALGLGGTLRTLEKHGLINQELTICHHWHLLSEKYWVMMKVIGIVLID